MRLPGCATVSAISKPFFPKDSALGEQAQLSVAAGEIGTREHGGQEQLTAALVAQRPVKGRHSLPEAVDRSTIVTLGLIGDTKVLVRQRVQDALPTGGGERQGALAGGDGLVIRAHGAEMDGQKDRDLSQPTRVVEGRCEGLGLAQIRQDTPKVARRQERRAQGEPEIDGLLARGVRSPADAAGH